MQRTVGASPPTGRSTGRIVRPIPSTRTPGIGGEMSRTLLALFGALACGGLGAAAADDPVTKKLTAARADYDAKAQKVEAGVEKWLEKREAAARLAGDKKVL